MNADRYGSIFVDIDGTLTADGEVPWGEPRGDRIAELKRLIEIGVDVVIWSGRGKSYAEKFAERYGIYPVLCLAKPDLIIDDNPNIRPRELIVAPEVLDE